MASLLVSLRCEFTNLCASRTCSGDGGEATTAVPFTCRPSQFVGQAGSFLRRSTVPQGWFPPGTERESHSWKLSVPRQEWVAWNKRHTTTRKIIKHGEKEHEDNCRPPLDNLTDEPSCTRQYTEGWGCPLNLPAQHNYSRVFASQVNINPHCIGGRRTPQACVRKGAQNQTRRVKVSPVWWSNQSW